MEKYKAPISFKIIYYVTAIIYYLSAFACLIAFGLTMLILTGILKNGLQLHVLMPVEFDLLEIGNLYMNSSNIKVEIVEAVGKVHFIDTPLFLARWISLALIFVVTGGFYILDLFWKFIKNVKNGIIFEFENIRLLKKIGFGLMGLWLYLIIYSQILKYTIAKWLEFDDVSITGDDRNYVALLLFGLFIWVLSHIFIKGSELEEENKLTI
ncbi:MAG: DUF2975 domain-containing protein [Mariniphaga sp.]|nr:DUF2975 domain-containing protein [Mariniphaga sp.]